MKGYRLWAPPLAGLNRDWQVDSMGLTTQSENGRSKKGQLKSEVIWVTGASSGLGRSLVLSLAKQGHQVIASARDEKALQDLQALSPNIFAMPCDMVDDSSLASVKSKIEAQFSTLDQIILNAGTCEYLDFPEPDWLAIRRVMEVNYFGTINCLKVALPLLRSSHASRPHIVAIASQVTNAPFPRSEAYGASKAALQYFFDSLRIDLADDNIDITVVNPGFVDTPLTRKNNFEMPFLMDVDQAAKRIIKNIASRPRVYSFPKRLQGLLLISKLFPSLWQKMVTQKNVTSDNKNTAAAPPDQDDK
ncbi:MAG: short-subunit dehydrogenase [Polaribacter sp.]|jgi:short-subunit dehydrogenase